MTNSTYEALGVAPVINACGIYTDLGGSTLSPEIWAALGEVNDQWASIPELLAASGRRIADLVGAPAARVVPGASAAIALAAGACIAGRDGEVNERLPDAPGVARGLIMQRGHRYKYARCALLAGAHIVEVGAPGHTDAAALRAALLGPEVAALLHPAHLDGDDGTLPLADVVALAGEAGVPVIVDAAYLSFPTALISDLVGSGADLVCFSAKYFYGPNAGGFLAGRTDLIEAVTDLDFTGYESGRYLTFGRPFKMDRTTIVATVLALQEWLTMDHDARWASYGRRVLALQAALADLPGLHARPAQFTLDERLIDAAPNALVLRPGSAAAATAMEDALATGTPRLLCVREGEELVVCVETVPEADDATVAERLRSAAEGLS